MFLDSSSVGAKGFGMHIYAVSRLFHKPPTNWLGAIRRMERGGEAKGHNELA